jgi:phosphate-selective porin OprO/OprP
MVLKHKLLAGVAVCSLAWPAIAAADPATDARIAALEAQVQALSSQVQDLKAEAAQTETLQAQVADLKASTADSVAAVREDALATTVSLANGRPTFSTSDGQFTASLRGVFQLDAAHYSQKPAGPLSTDFRRGSLGDATQNDHARDLNDGTNFRRARLGIEGKAFGDFEYNFLYDFGGSGVEDAGKISSAWVQYDGLGPVRVRIGAFSPPAGLEEPVSTNGSLFAERASPSELVRSLAAGDGRSAAGVFANGDRWNVSAAVTGGTVATQTFDEQLGIVARAAFVPFKRDNALIHLGVNTTVVVNPAATTPDIAGVSTTALRLRDRPELRVDATQLVDTGNIDANGLRSFGGEFGAQWNNLYVQAEYFDITVDRKGPLSNPRFDGWYVQTGWTITGEPRRYSITTATFEAPRPDKPFDWKKGQWGAWELGLRYSDLDLNYHEGAPGTAQVADAIRGGEQKILTVGLNWYVNAVLRFQAAFQDVNVNRLSPGGAAFLAGSTPPAGAQVGQNLQIWSFRTQYAF